MLPNNELIVKEMIKINNINYFHGTSDTINISNIILPPVYTDNKREDWRTKYEDKVFFTSSLPSAIKFAKKACAKYGGNPAIYKVEPLGEVFNTVNNEYIADEALVIEKIS